MLFKKYAGNPAKKKANKFSREQFGTTAFGGKPALTEQDIIRITRRYGGFTPDKGKTNNGHKIIMTDFYFGFPCHSVDFCDDAVRTVTGTFNPKYDVLKYVDLRDDEDINMSYLKRRFEGFPDKFCNALMELREA